MGDSFADDKPSLLVFSDDWGRHPSSCQHLIRQLLPDYRVWWVNTIGMRSPKLDRATLSRAAEKVWAWRSRNGVVATAAQNPQVVEPRMWPWFTRGYDRRINRALLLRQLTPIVDKAGPVVGVSTLPLVADLVHRLPVSRWVYYCVDDFSEWPGLDQTAISQTEARFVRDADVLICVSETLRDRLARWGRSSHLLTHGVDLEHWKADTDAEPLPELQDIPRPLVLFWGLVDRRMDVEFLACLAEDLDHGTVVLLGPQASPAPAIRQLPRVVCLPQAPFEQLPRYAAEAAVLAMPYADLPVTRAMQPLKLKEYLATGKPVVVRDLPAVQPWADALDVARTPQEFSAAVRHRIVAGLPESQRRARVRLSEESWAAKARQFIHVAL